MCDASYSIDEETLEREASLADAVSEETVAELAETVEENESAEVIGFAPPVAAREEAEDEITIPVRSAAAAAGAASVASAAGSVPATSGSSALNPASKVTAFPMPARPEPAPEPEWRKEVTRRLEDYRAKRRRNGQRGSAAAQARLEFDETAVLEPDNPEYRATLRRHSISRPVESVVSVEEDKEDSTEIVAPMTAMEAEEPVAMEEIPQESAMMELAPERGPEPEPPSEPEARATEPPPIEVSVPAPQFDFVLLADDEPHPRSALVPVADLRERSRAAMLDTFFLLFSFGGFLVLFRAYGGHLSFGKPEALIYLLAFFLFYVQYFVLFSVFGGATPGMYFRGLRVVGFDGAAPEARQLLWRAFGYLVSGGTLLLGFLWALWDEDHLTWHDRMSQTYLTNGAPAMWRDLAGPATEAQENTENSSAPEAT